MQIIKAEQNMANVLGDIEKCVYKNSDEWSGETFFNDMAQNNRLYLVAKEDDKLIGFVGASYFMDEADILRVAILPEYQRKGVATQLMQEMIDCLKKLLVKKVMLEVEENNIKAQGLYKKVGFKEISKRKNYYKNGKTGLIYCLEI